MDLKEAEEPLTHPETARVISAGAGLGAAVRAILASPSRHLVVMDGSRVVGMVAEADIVARGVDQQTCLLEDGLTVADVMTEIPGGIPETSTLREALETMWRHGTSAIPIVRDGAVAGVITHGDVLQALARPIAADDRDEDSSQVGARGKVIMSHPLMQNAMLLLAEAGI